MTRSLGALLLALLAHCAHGHVHGHGHGGFPSPPHRVPSPGRAAAHRLPFYMMHLYRNFRSNLSRPLDDLERDASKRADTVKSLMAKSKTRLISLQNSLVTVKGHKFSL